MKAALFVGGREGHKPTDFADWCRERLQATAVTGAYTIRRPAGGSERGGGGRPDRADPVLGPFGASAVIQHHDQGRSGRTVDVDRQWRRFGRLAWAHGRRVSRPAHLALPDRGQFVAHPPVWPDNPVPSDDNVDHDITICRPDEPITRGRRSVRMTSEQHFMLVDPSIEGLATTTFPGDHLLWIDGAIMQVVCKRRCDRGRAFSCSTGHELADVTLPQVPETLRRGMLWAART